MGLETGLETTLQCRARVLPEDMARKDRAHWHRLPREAVAAPSLAVSKARLDGALSTLGWGKGSLPMAGGWNWMVFEGLCRPEPLCEATIA